MKGDLILYNSIYASFCPAKMDLVPLLYLLYGGNTELFYLERWALTFSIGSQIRNIRLLLANRSQGLSSDLETKEPGLACIPTAKLSQSSKRGDGPATQALDWIQTFLGNVLIGTCQNHDRN